MKNLELLIFIAGILQLGILLASWRIPKTLDWKTKLAHLDPLPRQIVWVHGAFVVFMIVGFGILSVLYAAEIASGTPLARGVALFIGLFWTARTCLHFFVFDARPLLTSTLLKVGYHGLTFVFSYLVIVYYWAAFATLN